MDGRRLKAHKARGRHHIVCREMRYERRSHDGRRLLEERKKFFFSTKKKKGRKEGRTEGRKL